MWAHGFTSSIISLGSKKVYLLIALFLGAICLFVELYHVRHGVVQKNFSGAKNLQVLYSSDIEPVHEIYCCQNAFAMHRLNLLLDCGC